MRAVYVCMYVCRQSSGHLMACEMYWCFEYCPNCIDIHPAVLFEVFVVICDNQCLMKFMQNS